TRRAEHFLLTSIVNYSWRVFFWTRPAQGQRPREGQCDTQRPADQAITSIGLDVQAIFRRRRHQPSRPPLAKSSPGTPAPAMGPGTAAGVLPIPELVMIEYRSAFANVGSTKKNGSTKADAWAPASNWVRTSTDIFTVIGLLANARKLPVSVNEPGSKLLRTAGPLVCTPPSKVSKVPPPDVPPPPVETEKPTSLNAVLFGLTTKEALAATSSGTKPVGPITAIKYCKFPTAPASFVALLLEAVAVML